MVSRRNRITSRSRAGGTRRIGWPAQYATSRSASAISARRRSTARDATGSRSGSALAGGGPDGGGAPPAPGGVSCVSSAIAVRVSGGGAPDDAHRLDLVLQAQEPVQERLRTRRAAGDVDVH